MTANEQPRQLMDRFGVPPPLVIYCPTCGREMRVRVKPYIDYHRESGQEQAQFWAYYLCPKFTHRVFLAPVVYLYNPQDATQLSLSPEWRPICTSQF